MDNLCYLPYRPEDCPGLAALFYDTVHRVCRRDYTLRELNAWASGQVDLEAWNASFLAHRTLVAWHGSTIAGFGDLDPSGTLTGSMSTRIFSAAASPPLWQTCWRPGAPLPCSPFTPPGLSSPFSCTGATV